MAKKPTSREQQGEPPADAEDAVSLLEQQHRAVEDVFAQLRASSGQQRTHHIQTLAELLVRHTSIEERIFYPAVRTTDTEELLTESFDDHNEMKKVLLHLLDANPADPDLGEVLEELEGMVEDHVLEEEADLFPRARSLLSREQLAGIAQEMIALQAEEAGRIELKSRLAEELTAADQIT